MNIEDMSEKDILINFVEFEFIENILNDCARNFK